MHTIINPYRDPFGPRPLAPNPYNPFPYNPPSDNLGRINELRDYVTEIKPIVAATVIILLAQGLPATSNAYATGALIASGYGPLGSKSS